jgi:hypothetical protein
MRLGVMATEYEKEHVKRMGCASHSDFDPDQHKIENALTFLCEKHDADVRDKLLDELVAWRIEYMKTRGRGFAEYLAAEGRKLIELRNQVDVPE